MFVAVRGIGNTECPPAPADNPACRKAEIYMFAYQRSSLRFP